MEAQLKECRRCGKVDIDSEFYEGVPFPVCGVCAREIIGNFVESKICVGCERICGRYEFVEGSQLCRRCRRKNRIRFKKITHRRQQND